MTNEEKANEISEHYATSHYFPNDEEIIAYDAAMKMAEWKDKQYAKTLAKLIVELDELKHQVNRI